jgi:hypothetical protein
VLVLAATVVPDRAVPVKLRDIPEPGAELGEVVRELARL